MVNINSKIKSPSVLSKVARPSNKQVSREAVKGKSLQKVVFDKDHLLKLIVENALDFLSRSIEDFEKFPKFSVIHFHSAVELFIKARLMSEHWSLVVAKQQEPDWDKFVAGDFKSVYLEEAANKLDKVVRSGLSSSELKAFQEITRHRNKMVHFFHEAVSVKENQELLSAIAKQQLHAWYFLHRLLATKWNEVFDPWADKIKEIDAALRERHAFLQVIFENLKKEIEMQKKAGAIFESYPSCRFKSQRHEQAIGKIYESKCVVCELTETCLRVECPNCATPVLFVNEGFSKCDKCGDRFEPEDVVDLLIDKEAAFAAKKDGDNSYEPGNCSECDGYHTVVRLGDDNYFCASCFGIFESLERCEWCNEPNTGNMEDSYFTGCSVCDGKGGWDKD